MGRAREGEEGSAEGCRREKASPSSAALVHGRLWGAVDEKHHMHRGVAVQVFPIPESLRAREERLEQSVLEQGTGESLDVVWSPEEILLF